MKASAEGTGAELDVLVIGGGPGGMSAALWARHLNLRALLVDRHTELGGQLLDIHTPLLNYLGHRVDQGRDLQSIFKRHLSEEAVPVRLGVPARLCRLETPEVRVGDETLQPRYVILATGTRRRRLGLPSEAHFWRQGVTDSASRDLDAFEGRRVAVVGGGDSALQTAVNLAKVCPEVFIIVRGSTLRAREAFQRKVFGTPQIAFIWESEVVKFEGGDRLEAIVVQQKGARRRLEVGGVCLCLGVEPNLELLEEPLALTETGYVSVDQDQRTSARHIFAIGDASSPRFSSIAQSAGQGMVAAKAISLELEEGRGV